MTMASTDLAPPSPDAICAQLREQTLQACKVARIAAGIVAEGIATGVPSLLDGVREREKELDTLDRDRYFALENIHTFDEINEILQWRPAEWDDSSSV